MMAHEIALPLHEHPMTVKPKARRYSNLRKITLSSPAA